MKSVGCGNKRNKGNSEILGKGGEGPSKNGKNTEKDFIFWKWSAGDRAGCKMTVGERYVQ
ncbi:MAG: hypothetical protein COS84_05160 [Armatimonadetes bacterium CG07_land_8_20_14_0_80_40_9]|nr:MAG: hypothetical protein COS84_05160 [Armatimonadetes bacterium CG07_land_8_20_14_0_80_40_9]